MQINNFCTRDIRNGKVNETETATFNDDKKVFQYVVHIFIPLTFSY